MTFTYKQTKIHYTASGKGESVILLHGFLENSSMWKPLQKELSKTHAVYALDLPGHGRTEAIGYIHSMEDYAALVLAFAEDQQLKSFSLIGHSMGGYVALALAELQPEKIKKLILLNSSPLPDSETKQQERNRAITMIQKYPEAFIRMAVKHLFLPKDQKRLSSEIDTAISEAKQCSQQGIINTLKGMRDRKDRTEVLKKMSDKSLILLGKEDKVIDFEKTKYLAKEAGVELKILPGGHMSYIEHPDLLLKTVQEFLVGESLRY
ncbi:alpha/beta fold hydrolase [Psychroflexus sediminis]|uniref:Pimeloyl-ACP methyl ester carboxylesterase n=1 Tax=Psychroflexus sediminis TaxID=470826 RepID=A0A1G7YH13_9FLAO|nr:alpha/beta hydrolase [Psychroflexus sediminis]SDG95596.1 Pimeloyl-ACP methyl ester carboxylesterase [Psychroflexus sediminis]